MQLLANAVAHVIEIDDLPVPVYPWRDEAEVVE
jgi:hypothetical protein